MTRKERHLTALQIAEMYLLDDPDARPKHEVLEAVQHAFGAPAPAWWAEHVYEERARRREDREEAGTNP